MNGTLLLNRQERQKENKGMKPGLRDNLPPVLREPEAHLDVLVRTVIGAAISVHRELGPGFPERIYGNALEVELKEQNVAFERESKHNVYYKGMLVGESILDFSVGGEIVVEIKAVDELAPVHAAQVLSYLKATDRSLAY